MNVAGHRTSLTFKLTALFAALFVTTSLAVLAIAFAQTNRTYSSDEVRRRTREVLADLGIAPIPAAERALLQDLLGVDVDAAVDVAAQRARDDALTTLLGWSLVALAVATIVFVAAAWLLARRSLRPLRAMASTAQSISATNLDVRLRTDGPDDEVAQLAGAFDDTFDRLRGVFEAQRNFAAHASHELRTPLSTLRAEAELALDDAPAAADRLARTALDTVARSERLIDSLLALTRAESGGFAIAPLSLADLAGDVVGDLIELADSRAVRIDLALDEACVLGDRALVESMVENLVRNAIVHNVAHGRVAVSVADRILTVENSGPRLDATAVAKLAQPFHRPDHSLREPGHGLGLAIVDAVAAAHGATVTRSPLADGGLRTVVRFPPAGEFSRAT